MHFHMNDILASFAVFGSLSSIPKNTDVTKRYDNSLVLHWILLYWHSSHWNTSRQQIAWFFFKTCITLIVAI